jgi:hypothetical protein
MRSGLWLPLFEELADPGVVARLAAEAEERGWHGVFVWDQLRWREPIRQVADPWITLAAIAAATEQVRLGPMVTPLARRRPAKVAVCIHRQPAVARTRTRRCPGVYTEHSSGSRRQDSVTAGLDGNGWRSPVGRKPTRSYSR